MNEGWNSICPYASTVNSSKTEVDGKVAECLTATVLVSVQILATSSVVNNNYPLRAPQRWFVGVHMFGV